MMVKTIYFSGKTLLLHIMTTLAITGIVNPRLQGYRKCRNIILSPIFLASNGYIMSTTNKRYVKSYSINSNCINRLLQLNICSLTLVEDVFILCAICVCLLSTRTRGYVLFTFLVKVTSLYGKPCMRVCPCFTRIIQVTHNEVNPKVGGSSPGQTIKQDSQL